MREILSEKEKRQLALLDVLTEDKTATLLRISTVSGYPARTLSDDISQLNALISPSKIISNISGLSLYIPQNSSPREIYSRFLKESREYQLLLYLFENETDSLADISDALYVSESTLKRMIHGINEKLKDYGILILSAPFRIGGDEAAISLFFSKILRQLSRNDLITETQRVCLLDLCSRAARWYRIPISFPSLNTIFRWTFVRLMRIKYGHHMNLPKREEGKTARPTWLNDGSLTAKLYTLFGVRVSEDIIFEIFYLYANDGYAHDSNALRRIIHRSPEKEGLCEAIKKMIDRVAAELAISTEGTEELLLRLFNMRSIPDAPVYAIYDKGTIFLKGFQRENERIYNAVKNAVREEFSQMLSIHETESMIYTVITMWPGIVEKTADNIPPISVGFFFDTDMGNARLVAELLQHYSRLKISVILPDPIHDLDLNSVYQGVDLLITNIPGLEDENTEIVCVQEYPGKRDWNNIIMSIEMIHGSKCCELGSE